MSYKLDIFSLLNKISSGDTTAFRLLSEEEQKEFSPYVMQMWLKGANNNLDARLVLMNEVSNQYVFNLQQHKNLLYKTFCVAHGYGMKTHYKFQKKGRSSLSKVSEKVLMDYYGYRQQEAQDALQNLSCDDIVYIAEKLGYEKDEIIKIKKEHKNANENDEKRRNRRKKSS